MFLKVWLDYGLVEGGVSLHVLLLIFTWRAHSFSMHIILVAKYMSTIDNFTAQNFPHIQLHVAYCIYIHYTHNFTRGALFFNVYRGNTEYCLKVTIFEMVESSLSCSTMCGSYSFHSEKVTDSESDRVTKVLPFRLEFLPSHIII